MTAVELEQALAALIEWDGDEELEAASTSTFAAAGILSRNAGLVVRLADGSEFQITIVQSRLSEAEVEADDENRLEELHEMRCAAENGDGPELTQSQRQELDRLEMAELIELNR